MSMAKALVNIFKNISVKAARLITKYFFLQYQKNNRIIQYNNHIEFLFESLNSDHKTEKVLEAWQSS